jgi:hypothetical protein
MILAALYLGLVKLTFTKEDGTQRTMTATQEPMRIPFHKQPKTVFVQESVQATTACPVFDVDLQEWRSFCWDQLLKAETSGGVVLFVKEEIPCTS